VSKEKEEEKNRSFGREVFSHYHPFCGSAGFFSVRFAAASVNSPVLLILRRIQQYRVRFFDLSFFFGETFSHVISDGGDEGGREFQAD
jgi:hypothetical protein